MKVSDILRLKGSILYTISPNDTLLHAVNIMSQMDLGSLAAIEHGELVGMLTFREIIHNLADHEGVLDKTTVRKIMDDHPITCTPETELDAVRVMMIEHHCRYMPVMENRMLMGIISFYDVAKTVVEQQNFENKMLKAYIRNWPSEETDKKSN